MAIFKPIRFHPISELVLRKADEVIAQAAVEVLRDDISKGLEHFLLARVFLNRQSRRSSKNLPENFS